MNQVIFHQKFPFILIFSFGVIAQQKSGITKLFEKDGLDIHFIYYNEGNGTEDNGVVIFLENKNDYPISYKVDKLIE